MLPSTLQSYVHVHMTAIENYMYHFFLLFELIDRAPNMIFWPNMMSAVQTVQHYNLSQHTSKVLGLILILSFQLHSQVPNS